MDGHSLLEINPSELAGQVGTVFQDPFSVLYDRIPTRELAFGCENLGLPRGNDCFMVKSGERVGIGRLLKQKYLCFIQRENNRSQSVLSMRFGGKSIYFDEPSANLDYAATKPTGRRYGKTETRWIPIFVVEHRFIICAI